MHIIFALAGGFLKWLLQFKDRKARKSYKEIVWKKDKGFHIMDYDSGLVWYGYLLAFLILFILALIDKYLFEIFTFP